MHRMQSLLIVAAILLSAAGAPLHAQERIPVGTVVAVVLEQSLDSRTVKPGKRVVGYIGQDVPLENKRSIRARSKVFGEVMQVQNGDGVATLGIRFVRIEAGKEQLAISAKARAVANPLLVTSAGIPTNFILGASRSALNTLQIGDDTVYGTDGPVENPKGEVVGKSVPGGVLVTVSNPPGSDCEGMPLSKRPQPTWVFAASACGVYGFSRFQLENGKDASAGENLITRHNKHEQMPTNVKLPQGTAFLLSISEAPERK